MKKLSICMIFLLSAIVAQAALVDDFEGYSPGIISQVTGGNWVPFFVTGTDPGNDSGVRQIAADPTDALNQLIFIETTNAGQYGMYGVFPDGTAIADGTTGTFFTKFYVTTTALDQSFGLTSIETPTSGGFGNFNCQVALVRGNLLVRNGGGSTTVGTFSAETWHYLWIVVDNAANTYDVYINSTGADATIADRVAQNFAFRSGVADGDMRRFYTVANYGSNITSGTRLHFDNMESSPGVDLSVPAMVRPYGPSVEQGAAVGTTIPTTLKWKAGLDPDGVYAVNPAIVDQYIFMSDTDPSEPNMIYIGATGIDPGTDDPDSEYFLNREVDKLYYWAVVEAIEGYVHNGTDNPALTPGVSSLADVDPNNIIGPIWSYESTKSLPSITVQPADVRVFTTDPSAVFTVEFTSLVNEVTATWYKNDVALTGSESNVSIVTEPFSYSTLTIDSPTAADEGKYYCILSVEEGTDDDLQTATRLLIIKKLLAQFDFEQDLADSSGNGAPAGVGKSVAGLSEPNELAATPVALTFVEGIEGDAVYLDGDQFIDFGIEGYPKAGPLDTIGDARGAGYEKQGFGLGMEQGSILCWIKPASIGAVYANANGSDDTHFGLTTPGTNSGRIIVRGRNWDNSYQEIGTAAGGLNKTDFSLQDGQWHMLAASWNDSTVRVYINGEQVATTTTGFPELYTAWERGNILGASRTGGARHILNSLLTGAVDSLRIYNYVIPASDIAVEYMNKNELGYTPCADHNFTGSAYNLDNSGSSYCRVDLADFVVIAENWLSSGLYSGL